MPDKQRYWRDPQKHRKESRDRRNRLHTLGISHRFSLSPQAQINLLTCKNNWRKAHRNKSNKGSEKYRKKLIRLFGTCSLRAVWQHTMLRASVNTKLRKARLKQYERKQTTAALLPR